MVLATQFNAFSHPFTVLLALPFSISGALMALWIAGQSLNVYSLLGMILLMGIAKKNSILLVDFTNQIRAQGAERHEALLEACPLRLRPILMTSIATIAGALPPALAIGPGAELQRPMALALVGGMVVSTLLTLFVVPAAYSVLDDVIVWNDDRRKRGVGLVDGAAQPGRARAPPDRERADARPPRTRNRGAQARRAAARRRALALRLLVPGAAQHARFAATAWRRPTLLGLPAGARPDRRRRGLRHAGHLPPPRDARSPTAASTAREVECPYHGWRFEPRSGQCQAIPSLTADSPLRVDRIYAAAFPCREADGFFWVFLPEGPTTRRTRRAAGRLPSRSARPARSRTASSSPISRPTCRAASTTGSSASWTRPTARSSISRGGGGAGTASTRRRSTSSPSRTASA